MSLQAHRCHNVTLLNTMILHDTQADGTRFPEQPDKHTVILHDTQAVGTRFPEQPNTQ